MKNILLIAGLSFLAVAGFSQSGNFSVFDSAIVEFERANPQEKVFVQTNRQHYYAGDTVWMKAWCTLNNAPTYLSRILYIDLTNKNGEVVIKKMYRLDSLSSSAADFLLPQTLQTGTYRLNAYTLWMKNFPQSQFSMDIPVFGLLTDSAKNGKGIPDKPTLKFFPEGGNLVTGITNRVAFKATGFGNLPENVEGYIADNADRKITDIKAVHDGMGLFEFVPEQGKNYTAHIKRNALISYYYPLPVSKQQGISVRVENSNPNKIFATLSKSDGGHSKVTVIAQINNIIIYKASLDIGNEATSIAINKKDLPGGILQITVFNENNQPLAERIVFVENYKLEKPPVNIQSISSEKRGLNVLDITWPGKIGSQSLSCLITSYVPDNGDEQYNVASIASALLLTSDVKGYVHNPGYYFKDKSAETLKNLDLLLMTQGWRSFEWQQILKGDLPNIKYPVETSINYKGQVFKTGSTKHTVQDGFVSFIFRKKNENKMIADATIDSNGYFGLTNVNFYDTADLSYMATNNKKVKFVTNVKMRPNYIDSLQFSQLSPELALHRAQGDSKDIFAADWMKNSNLHEKILERVVVKGTRTKEEVLNDKYATGEFNKRPGIIIDPTDFRQGKSLADMVQVSVPGIKIDKSENFFEPVMKFGISQEVLQYSVNGRMVNEKDVYNIDEDQIAMVKFYGSVLFEDPFDMNPQLRPHLAIYTKDKDRPYIAVHEKRYISQEVRGYSIVKKFYEPDESSIKNGTEDNRFTLYWNPDLMNTADKTSRIKFL